MKRINNQQTSEVCSGSISFTVCQQLDCYLLFVIYHVLVTVNYSALPCHGLWLVKLAKYEYSKKKSVITLPFQEIFRECGRASKPYKAPARMGVFDASLPGALVIVLTACVVLFLCYWN